MDSLGQTVRNSRRFGSNRLDFVIFFSFMDLFIYLFFVGVYLFSVGICLSSWIYFSGQIKPEKCRKVDR
jgi:hypothetical protein